MKKLLPLSFAVLALALLAACRGPNTASVLDTDVETDEQAAADAAAVAMAEGRVVDMTLGAECSPNVLNLKKGENVVLRLKSDSGTHAFISSELALNISIAQGETKAFNIPTSTDGTFTILCGTSAPTYDDMTAQIVIE